jgi:hypothetical protein
MKDFRPLFFINKSQKMPIPFAGYIISMNMLPRKFKEVMPTNRCKILPTIFS